jgi:hypothetical protein
MASALTDRGTEKRPHCRDCIPTPRIALVGCGAAKQDTDEAVPAKDLYSSSYFSLKQEYSEETCDAWKILSAKHGLLNPDEEITPYDASLDPTADSYIGDYEAGKWAVRTSRSISMVLSFWSPYSSVVLLAGQDYLEHINDDVFRQVRAVERPFEDTDGIMEQMQLLRTEIDTYHPAGQSDIDHWQRVQERESA